MDWINFRQIVFKQKKTLLSIILGFVFVGVLIVLITPKTYKAQSVLLPESKESSLGSAGGLSQLASSIPGLSGISLPSSGADAFRPEFYPTIVQSTPFILALRDYQFFHSDFQSEMTLKSYMENDAPINPISYLKKYTIGLPGIILSSFRSEEDELPVIIESQPKDSISVKKLYRPSVGEFKFMKDLRDMVSVGVDKKTGLITISVETTNALVSANLAQFTQEYLVNFMEKYRNEKQKRVIIFLEGKQAELESQFLNDQSELAGFKERNFNVSSAFLLNKQENLASQYELSRNLYFNINSQLEQARINLNQQNPIFATIEPVYVPPLKNKPQTFLLLFLTGSLGIITAAIYLLVKNPTLLGNTE